MEIEDWLCGIAQAEAQLSPYLGKWLATETDHARLNPAAFKVTLISRSRTDVLATTGTTAPNHSDEVAAWLRSEVASRTCWSGVIGERNTVLTKSGLPPDTFSRVANIF